MTQDFMMHWVERHIPAGPYVCKDFEHRWSGENKVEFVRLSFTRDTPLYGIRAWSFDSVRHHNGWVPVASINKKGIINIKPESNKTYVVANITDTDLSQFELRTFDGKGAKLICIDCTTNIKDKSHKWTYEFYNTLNDTIIKDQFA